MYGVRWVLVRGVTGVPGMGSLKCSLNHLNKLVKPSKVCWRNRKPSGSTVINSCLAFNLWIKNKMCKIRFIGFAKYDKMKFIQVNLSQTLLFLHQLTHNMTTNCSLNYKFNRYMKIPSSNLGRTCCVQKLFLTFRTNFVHNMFSLMFCKKKSF